MSERSEYVKVYDKKRKVERIVTRAAYKILAGKTYDLLEGEVEAPVLQKKSAGAEPAEDKISTGDLNGITETKADVNPVVEGTIKVIRKKPGPKPKTHAQE